MRLTDLQIRSLELPKGATKQKTFFDDAIKGFGLRVSVGGAKSFVLMYGKRRKLKTLGRYPDVSLAEARVAAKKALGMVAGVKDGMGHEAGTLPFLVAREQFLEDSRMRNKPSTYEAYKRVLLLHFTFPKKIGDISRLDVMSVVDELKERPSEARHAFVAIRTMMNWAVLRGLITNSPVPPLRYKVPSRSRILSDDELTRVWHRAEAVGYPYGTIVQLLILTGQRRGEIAGLRRGWISDDAITFPVGFCKNKREHKIPIGSLTKDIIAAIPKTGDLLFPARGKSDQPFNGWSKAKRQFDHPLEIAPYTLHDLRRTYSSNLAKAGVPIHVTERLLNHVSGTISGVAAVYNRHDYWEEIRVAVSQAEIDHMKISVLFAKSQL
jgi:integrase